MPPLRVGDGGLPPIYQTKPYSGAEPPQWLAVLRAAASRRSQARVPGSMLSTMSNTGLPMRTLGRTGLQVTQLGYGAMELRGAPRGSVVDDAQAERVLRAVLDG